MTLIMLLAVSVALSVSSLAAGAEAEKYLAVTQTARVGDALKVEPSVVYEVSGQADLDALAAAQKKPAVVLVTVDADMKVALSGGTQDFKTVFDTYIKGKAVPALRIADAAGADAFIAYMTDTYYIQDITVVSSDIEVLRRIYADEVCYVANSVYDLTDKELTANRYDFWPYIGEANAAGCNILMINGADKYANVAASYAASLSKVCWGYVTGDAASAAGAVAAGCYGIAGKDLAALQGAIKLFEKNGFTRAQFIAAHRGITAYANENSLTALAAAANEGATHVEVDLQITSDGELILCHDSDASPASTAPEYTYVALKTLSDLRAYKLDTFSETYGDTFATLEEVVNVLAGTDVVMILELKLDNASSAAVDTFKAIEKLKAFMSEHDEMEGRWMAITFFAPYARQMRELMPEIPVGFLGNGNADNKEAWSHLPKDVDLTKLDEFIPFLREHNVLLDVTLSDKSAKTLQSYLARGYVQNTWTFKDTSHFVSGFNIATTDNAEACAFMVKEVAVGSVSLTQDELTAGKASVTCRAYNGWTDDYECEIIALGDVAEGNVSVMFYFAPTQATPYGIYSPVMTVPVA